MNTQGPNGISWADYTANPIQFRDRETGKRVWFCVHVSPGCSNCYAESLAHRYGGYAFEAPNLAKVEPYLDEQVLTQMLRFKPAPSIISGRYSAAYGPDMGMFYKNNRPRAAVFLGDMTDLFAPWVTDEWLDRIFAVCALRQDVDWMFLTKRAPRMREYLSAFAWRHRIGDVLDHARGTWSNVDAANWLALERGVLPNVFLGVSVEDQRRADERIPELLTTPAAVRYVSYEPALGPVDWCKGIGDWGSRTGPRGTTLDGVSLVIFGGESGGTRESPARPCDLSWGRAALAQCRAAGVAFHWKQMGRRPVEWEPNPYTDMGLRDQHFAGQPIEYHLRSSHGSDPAEWPPDCRVREMPGMVR